MSKQTSFSITRSFKPVMFNVVSVIIMSDAVFLLTIFLIIFLRDALQIDSTFAGLTLLLFLAKSLFTAYFVYVTIRNWLGVQYFVMDGQLILQSSIRQVDSSSRPLDALNKVSADNAYVMYGKQNYGTVYLEFSKAKSLEKVRLLGVDNPEMVSRALMEMSKLRVSKN